MSDKTDVAAVGSLGAMVASALGQLNNVALEYLPLITLVGAVTAVAALVIRVWSVNRSTEQARRNRAIQHKRMDLDRKIAGIKHERDDTEN